MARGGMQRENREASVVVGRENLSRGVVWSVPKKHGPDSDGDVLTNVDFCDERSIIMVEGDVMERKNVAQNRRARFEYFILETFEAGLVLTGTEIKSVREGHLNLKDGYAKVENGEMWLLNVHISPYDKGTHYNHDPVRPRKLLMHRAEIRKIFSTLREKGLTLVPLAVYIKDSRYAKVELGLAKGKNVHDKRESIQDRDATREMARAVRHRGRDEDDR